MNDPKKKNTAEDIMIGQRLLEAQLRDSIRGYDLPKKLPMDRALQVVQELYVDLVMES